MQRYDLRYAAKEPHRIDTLSFEARSLGGALDIARKSARGEWAELYEDGRPVCQLELVVGSGVWLVGGLSQELARQPAEHLASNPQPSPQLA